MSTITKDLGVVTAYGYAISNGYEGTEEEFAELMASYATVAEQAAQSADTAEEAAEAAAQAVLDANAAKTAAQAAQSAAESASTTAQGAATSASNSATSAASSASTASSAATTATGKATEAAASATNAAGSATDAQTAAEAAQAAAEAAVSSLSDFAPTVVNTASGDIASFTDGADDYPVKDLVVDIEPVQSGSGDPSTDNVRPITGWTGANVTRTGKNLFPNKTCQWPENKLIIGDDQIREGIFLKQGTYTVSARRSKGKIFCKTSSGSNITLTPNASTLSGTLTVAKDDYYRFWIYDSSGVTASDVEWFQLELGSTATDYETYQGDTYSVTFPTEAGTVYGGTLDVTTGVLTVDKMRVSLNISDMDGSETYPGWKNQNWIDNLAMGEYAYSSPSGSLSNISNISGYMFSVNRTNNVLYLRIDTYGLTQTEWKTQYPNLAMQIVYPLATPITYQCTPTEVKTLLGANNIFANTGSVDVEYCADTKKYIDNAIAAAVASLS